MNSLQRCAMGLLASAAFVASHAQVPFPPPALAAATSIESATGALGAARAEFSSYLLLDVPEITLPGRVEATISSELPGTSLLVLLRQYPVPVRQSTSSLPAAQSGGSAAGPVPVAAPSVLVAAARLEPGERPVLAADFDITQDERFTMLAFAQGRWFFTVREVKVARKPQDQ